MNKTKISMNKRNKLHPGQIQCKFGVNCINNSCAFYHYNAKLRDIPCRYALQCSIISCPYKHPREICPRGTGCLNPKCPYHDKPRRLIYN